VVEKGGRVVASDGGNVEEEGVLGVGGVDRDIVVEVNIKARFNVSRVKSRGEKVLNLRF